MNRFILPFVVFLALAGVLFIGVRHSPDKSTMASALLGKSAPAFELPVLGEARKLSSREFAGKPWVLPAWSVEEKEFAVQHGADQMALIMQHGALAAGFAAPFEQITQIRESR